MGIKKYRATKPFPDLTFYRHEFFDSNCMLGPTNTGVAPQCRIGVMLACHVTEGTITSRPCRAPDAKIAECMAAVPLQTHSAYFTPMPLGA